MSEDAKYTIYRQLKNYQFFVVDGEVYRLNEKLRDLLKEKKLYLIPNPPENSKNLATFEKVAQFMIENGMKRSDTLVAVGGGATSDLAGFVASTLYRGVSWIVVPTTLLSFIDASIGGKVAINLALGKNLLGSFYQPNEVLFDFDLLKSLPKREWKSGLGELSKYAFLDDNIYQLILEGKREVAYQAAIDYKRDIVSFDFKERHQEGLGRSVLNLGHTIGHALEIQTSLSHGEAVFLGIYLEHEILLGKEQFIAFKDRFFQLKKCLELDLNFDLKLDWSCFFASLSLDKKNDAKVLSFIIVDPQPKNVKISKDEFISKSKNSESFRSLFKEDLG